VDDGQWGQVLRSVCPYGRGVYTWGPQPDSAWSVRISSVVTTVPTVAKIQIKLMESEDKETGEHGIKESVGEWGRESKGQVLFEKLRNEHRLEPI